MRLPCRISIQIVFLFVVGAFSQTEKEEEACQSLQTNLGERIVFTAQSNRTAYDLGANHAWNYANTEFRPACIVLPEHTQHVQIAMRTIYTFEVNYAVQSGGHSAMKGWNNVQNGVLILFSNMKNVSYNEDRDSITLQPGIKWGEALDALEPQGVAPMGGRVSTVGTGLLLGGGYSFLAPRHGFSSDAFISLDVVLVTGELVTATVNNDYSDLFRALKGGANRFGIVTRYEVSAIHVGTNSDKTWFGGLVSYPSSAAELVLKALAHYVRDVKDPNAALLSYFNNIPINGTLTLQPAVNMFYNGSELPSDVFGELLSIPATNVSLGPLSYHEIAFSIPDDPVTQIQLFGASALQSNEQGYLNAFDHWMNFSRTFQNDFVDSTLAFTPVLDPQILESRRRGGNPIDPPLGGYNAVQFTTTLPEGMKTVDAKLEAGRQLFFKQVPPSPGIPLYINECDEQQHVFETYGQYELLKQTYAKYDPTRFNIQHTKGPVGL